MTKPIDHAVLQEHMAKLADAMKQIGEDAVTMHQGDQSDENVQRARVGGALGSTIGIMAQLFGIEITRAVLIDMVSGSVADQFWALQKQLADGAAAQGKSEQQAAPLAAHPGT
jgi:hypothetical protein